MAQSFPSTKQAMENILEEELEINYASESNLAPGISVYALKMDGLVGSAQEKAYIKTTKITVRNSDGDIYAEVVFMQPHLHQSVAVIGWIELKGDAVRGQGIGRTLHEETIEYIDQATTSERIYTKLVNQQMKSVILDTGFKPVKNTPKSWYRRV